jgi:N-acetyl-gamma-glutamylphosphate reductase
MRWEATHPPEIDRFRAGLAEWQAERARHAFRVTNPGLRYCYFG